MCLRASAICSISPAGRKLSGSQFHSEWRMLTSGWYLELLGPLFQVHLGGLPVSALDVHGGVLGQIGNEMTLAKLVDSFLDGDDLKGAQGLGGLELLHVQGT